MARRSGIPGVGGSSVFVLMTVGVIGGIIADMLWYSLGLPGYNVPLQGCDTLSVGDAIQIAGTGGLTFVGFLTKSRDIPAFTFGLMLGGIFPKIITKALGAPRYGLFDINMQTGGIAPITTLRGTPLEAQGGGEAAGGEGDFISKMI